MFDTEGHILKKVSTSEQKSEGSESSTVGVSWSREVRFRTARVEIQLSDRGSVAFLICSAVVSVRLTDWVRTSSA